MNHATYIETLEHTLELERKVQTLENTVRELRELAARAAAYVPDYYHISKALKEAASPRIHEPDDYVYFAAALRFKAGTSDKFWNIAQEGPRFTVHFGRSGTSGVRQTKTFRSASEARREAKRIVAEKLAKGYRHA